MSLILTRSPGQQIFMVCPDGTKITVTLNGVKGNQARLMIDAPLSVSIARDDVKTPAKPIAKPVAA